MTPQEFASGEVEGHGMSTRPDLYVEWLARIGYAREIRELPLMPRPPSWQRLQEHERDSRCAGVLAQLEAMEQAGFTADWTKLEEWSCSPWATDLLSRREAEAAALWR